MITESARKESEKSLCASAAASRDCRFRRIRARGCCEYNSFFLVRDPEALTEIYQRYQRSIYQRVHDAELAEDIAGDVFVRMREGIDRCGDRGWPISAWLYRMPGSVD